ncbi:MAG: hypothetical protein EXR72_07725 [Myxococcales bacterium]|nr:hypothetical protein [Myxococcales bacterium]
MRRALPLCLLLVTGCYDLSELGTLYQPDAAFQGPDDAAIPDEALRDQAAEDRAVVDKATLGDLADDDLTTRPDLAASDGAPADLLTRDGPLQDLAIAPCAPGLADCDKNPATGCEVNLQSDPKSCGQCGAACAGIAHDTAGCSAGECVIAACTLPFADCDKSAQSGCESNTTTDGANCGGCGLSCGNGAVCSAGKCAMGCVAPQILCGAGCVDPRTDALHCNGCNLKCPNVQNGAPGCANAQCGIGGCNPGFGDCDKNPATGCEVNLQTAPGNCGMCGTFCAALPNSAPGCALGACGVGLCSVGYGDCNLKVLDGCEAKFATDPANCGKCGTACMGACTNGACGAWSPMQSNTQKALSAVWGTGQGEIYAVGGGGTIVYSANNGQTWSVKSITQQWLSGVWGSGPNDVYVVGNQVIYRSVNKGVNWNVLIAPPNVWFQKVWGSSAADVYVVGDGGSIAHTVNGGTAWTLQIANNFESLQGVWGSGKNDVYVVGSFGTILRSIDSGTTWIPRVGNTQIDLYGIWGSGPGDIYITGDQGLILHSDLNGGFSPLKSNTVQLLWTPWGSGKTDIYAVGWIGTIVHGDGLTMAPQPSGTANTLYGLWGSGPNNVFAVGSNGTILHHP